MPLDPGPSILSALLGGKTNLNAIRKSVPLQEQIDLTTGRLPGYREAQDRSLGDYATALKGIEGDVNRLSQQDIGTLGSLINKNANYDPIQGVKGIGDYYFGLLNQFSNNLADIGSDRVKLANAGIYGGRGGGGYGENILLNNISKNLVPAFSGIVNQINPTAQAAAADRYRNLGSTLDLIEQRAGIPFRTANLNLMPAEARSRFLQDEIAALSGLGGAVNQNLAGFQAEDNTIKQIANALNTSQDQALDLAMTAASMYFGGGAGGALGGLMGGMGGGGGGLGGLGGGGGGGGGGAAPSGGFTWMNPSPNYSAPITYNPYADINNYGPTSPGYNPYADPSQYYTQGPPGYGMTGTPAPPIYPQGWYPGPGF